jgi:hypothetical protein
MQAVFVELPAFERHREDYLDEDAYGRLQKTLMSFLRLGMLLRAPAVCASCVLVIHEGVRASGAAYG